MQLLYQKKLFMLEASKSHLLERFKVGSSLIALQSFHAQSENSDKPTAGSDRPYPSVTLWATCRDRVAIASSTSQEVVLQDAYFLSIRKFCLN